MANRLENTEHFFDILNQVRYKSNEYFLHGHKLGAEKKKIPTGNLNFLHEEGLVVEHVMLDEKTGRGQMIIDEEAVTRFHPNTVNNKEFWVQCKTNFPLLSVCSQPSKSMKEVNANTMSLPMHFGFLQNMYRFIGESKKPLNFLEIGFGYGNIFHLMAEDTRYRGIDYTMPPSMRKYSQLTEIDVSGVPKKLYKKNHYDIVYSCNVLQHCSQKDRFDYFQQAADVLKIGGHFMFTCNVYADDNKHISEFWGLKDENGRHYTQFFSQMTEVDTEKELRDRLLALGFEIKMIKKVHNCWGIITKKI